MITYRIARAPGKLVLIGEYAVLDGAPALAMAVDRLARIELTDQSKWVALGPAAARTKPGLIESTLEVFGEPPMAGTVDTRAFFHENGSKFGLGSSAAATVALAGALADLAGRTLTDETGWRLLTKAHTQFQQSQGSGIDLACSLFGGVISFERGDSGPEVGALEWPRGLEMCVIHTGKSASTAAFLEQWSAWVSTAPQKAARVMDELGRCSRAGVAAFRDAKAAEFMAAIRAYGRLLKDLGEKIGMPIVSEVHDSILQAAEEFGLVYKPSGAGGGDVGVAWSAGDADWGGFRARVRALDGCEPLDLKLADEGLLVESPDDR